jgi:hypothetical protein
VKTPEQAAQEAKAGINSSNAEAELQKLEQRSEGASPLPRGDCARKEARNPLSGQFVYNLPM